MERENHCENCGFDLSKLDMTVLYARKGAEPRRLFCPVCRSDRLKVTALERVFPRVSTGRWVRWRSAGAGGPSNLIPVGVLKLRVESEIESLSKEQICFRAVPVFTSGTRTLWPALPVMPEYLDCLDPAQVRLAREQPERFGRVVLERGRARYQCVLPLRGLKPTEWPTWECDLLTANPFSASATDVESVAFRGVTVRLWPNLKQPTHAWRYYVASINAATEEGMTLFAQGRFLRARMLVPPSDPDGRPASETSLEVVPMDQEVGREGESSPTGLIGATAQGRPAWIAVEFRQPGAPGAEPEPIGGGLLPVPPAVDVQSAESWSLGLDFGTSNTVVAIKRRDGTLQCVSPERGRERASTTHFLVDGGPPTLTRGLDLWPGGEWSGPARDLLPSELASHRRWTDLASEAAILGLMFGKDFGVPLRGVQGNASENIVSEFKWLRAVARDKSALARPEIVQALQSRFLEAAMLMTSAAILAEDIALPRTVNVNYSFPLAFDETDLETLRRAAEVSGERLKSLTGADFVFPTRPLVDEAQAAAGHTPSDKMFRVYLDLGGGSLEVLVDDTLARNGQLGHGGLHPHVFSTSLFFGGSVYLRSLVGASDSDRRGACVMPGVGSYTRLASAVRQSLSGRALLDSPQVIAESRRATAERRARVYVGYIIELVARVLAGVCLEHGRTPEGILDLSRNRLFTLTQAQGEPRWVLGASRGPGQKRVVEFSLVLLGNGWGFGDIVRDGLRSVEQMMAQRVQERLMALLHETDIAKEISDGEVSLLSDRLTIDVSFVSPSEGTHRKAAVALGLLGAHHSSEDAANFFKNRAPGRHGVLGFDLWLEDQGRKIPWYRPFGAPPEDDANRLAENPAQPVARAAVPQTPPAMPAAPFNPMGGASFPSVPGFPPMASPGVPPVAAVPPLTAAVPPLVAAAPPLVAAMPPAGATPPGAGAEPPPNPFASAAPFAMPAAMPAMPAMPPAMPQSPLDAMAWMLAQQLPQYAMFAAQQGTTPQALATQQLWSQVAALAAQQGATPEQLLAREQWQRMTQGVAMMGLPPEQLAWMAQQQQQAVSMAAQAAGSTPEAFLAKQRWESLVATLSPPAMPAMPAFPFDPTKR